jgi:hypothetical protein
MNNKIVCFLDESGDLGLNGSDYFILTVIIIKNRNEYILLKKLFKKIKKYKFKKELKIHNEIKSNKVSDNLKKYLLKNLSDFNLNIYSIIFDKTKLKNISILKSNKYFEVYLMIMNNLFNKIKLEKPFDLIIDRFISRNLENKFNIEFYKNQEVNCKIHHSDSENWVGIQTADIIAGACLKKVRDNDKSFIEIIKNIHQIYDY